MPPPPDPAAAVLLPDAAGVEAAAAALRRGELVGLPTETVYGLAGHALDPTAVARIFAAKRRPADNPLIVHLAAGDELARLARVVTPLARRLAAAYWPGPLTLVLAAGASVPPITRGGLDTVAVRVPDHPVALAVLQASGLPLAAPSANLSGRPSPTRAVDVVAELGSRVALVLDGGRCTVGVESTVVDARGEVPVVLREGAVTREDLGLSGGAAPSPGEVARSPGTRYRHYAPACAVEVLDGSRLVARAERAGAAGERLAVLASPQVLAAVQSAVPAASPGTGGVCATTVFGDDLELARELYGAFRAAEVADAGLLLVESVPEQGVGRAVMDRLRRAAAG